MTGTCRRCEAELAEGARYCSRCGLSVEQKSSFRVPQRTPRPHLRGGGVLPDESILWQGHVAWRALLPQMAVASAAALGWYVLVNVALTPQDEAAPFARLSPLLIGELLIAAILATYLLYRHIRESFVLTNRRMIHEVGILHRTTDFLEVIDIDDVGVEQALWERLLGTGTVTLESSDHSQPLLWMAGLYPAREIATLIDDARHRERVARGMHVEVI